jgi:cytoplasmic iron level regulating protein YaaA (DUF328/UPF0246 family)
VRVLLPPSEGKTTGGRGRSIARRGLSGPLAGTREQVLDALCRLLAGSDDAAAAALLLPQGVAAGALAANRAVRDSATTPALRRYTGVVYDGLGHDALDPAAQRAAARDALIFSGLWGVVRGDEPVPCYRVPAKAVLPGIGAAGSYWRPALDQHMPGLLGRGLIVDLRSSDYAAMWRPGSVLRDRVVTVRVLSPLPGGRYGVVSYNSKLGKGKLAAQLFRRAGAGAEPQDAQDVVAAWTDAGGARGEVATPSSVTLYTG